MGLYQPNRGLAPWPGVHRSCRTETFVRLCKTWPTSHRMDQHYMDLSQIVAAYTARQSGSQVELSRIWSIWNSNASWEKMAMTR